MPQLKKLFKTVTSASWSVLQIPMELVIRQIFLAPRLWTMFLALTMFGLQACVSRAEVEASLLFNNFSAYLELHPELCGTPGARGPAWDLMFYRRLNDGTNQVLRICNPLSEDVVSMKGDDYRRYLDALTPVRRR